MSETAPEQLQLEVLNGWLIEPGRAEHANAEVADLITVDRLGRGHRDSNRPDGRSRSGQMASREEMAQIIAHQDLIRSTLNDRGGEVEPPAAFLPPVAPPATKAPDDPHRPGGPKDPTDFQRNLPEDLAFDLATALNDYTQLAAERSRLAITPRRNYDKIEDARHRYEYLRYVAKKWTMSAMAELELSNGDQIVISRNEDKNDVRIVGRSMMLDTERLAEPKGLFAKQRAWIYDLWARQGGEGDKFFSRERLKGTAKKAGILAAVGLPIGLAAGALGSVLAGPVIGAAAAATLGRGVGRGLARSHVEKAANAKTVAAEQYKDRTAAQQQAIGDEHLPDSITDVYSDGIEKDVSRNRHRLVGAMVVGAATGFAGVLVSEFGRDALRGGHFPRFKGIFSRFPGAPKLPDNLQPSPTAPPASSQLPPALEHLHHLRSDAPKILKHGHLGREFNVEHGSGIIREINEYAHAHHYHGVTAQESTEIYQHLHQQFGRHIIKLETGRSTYLVGDDVRLSHPGAAYWWSPRVEAILREQLAKDAA